ncbi:unnamed protein product [Peniophora sp. CBMAI 1063]|nr:unnamed protein product [Peniophora sp. CBMAI 1063]
MASTDSHRQNLMPWESTRAIVVATNRHRAPATIEIPPPITPHSQRQPSSAHDNPLMPLPTSPSIPAVSHSAQLTDSDSEFDNSINAFLARTDKLTLLVNLTKEIAARDKRIGDIPSAETAVRIYDANDDLRGLINAALETGRWAAVRDRLAEVHPRAARPVLPATEESKYATIASWSYPFRGPAHKALWDHIVEYAGNAGYYAPYCAVVQSSGTGKSRCVDELGKERLVVPINLSDPRARGYPPSDRNLHAYFTRSGVGPSLDIRMDCFLCALMETLVDTLESLSLSLSGDDASVPALFREHMSSGQGFDAHGPQRVEFYDTVVERAQALENGPRVREIVQSASSTTARMKYGKGALSTHDMVQRLDETCRRLKMTTSGSEPVVTLAIDEAHTLMARSDSTDTDSALTLSAPFQSLCRALRPIGGDKVFALFISTDLKIAALTVPRVMDMGALSRRLAQVPTFTAFGWDQLARRLEVGPLGIPFDEIGFGYQVRLGRPLFSTRYHYLASHASTRDRAQASTLQFAAEKLLCAPYPPAVTGALAREEELACLAHRMPLAFPGVVRAASEQRQVLKHMRVCVDVGVHDLNPGSNSGDLVLDLATLNASEPLLSAAASEIMRERSYTFSAPDVLLRLLASREVDVGACGEGVVAMLLMTLARDEVVKRGLELQDHPGFFRVVDFMKCLFNDADGTGAGSGGGSIWRAKPSVFSDPSTRDTPFEDAFAGVHMHFNHFIKRGAQFTKPSHEPNTDTDSKDSDSGDNGRLGLSRLCGFFVRNAAVAFANANSQRRGTVDLGFALCDGLFVQRTAMGVVLVRVHVQTGPAYGDTADPDPDPDPSLFDAMDPFELGIFGPDLSEAPRVPVIRIVMVLGSESAAGVRSVEGRREGRFTAYDFWAAGVGEEVYGVVRGREEEVWRDLVREAKEGRLGVHGRGRGGERGRALRMAVTPMAGDEDGFWEWLERTDERGDIGTL